MSEQEHLNSTVSAGQLRIYQTADGRIKIEAPLGYARWENFQTAIQRAMKSCEASGHVASDHFRGVTKFIVRGRGAESVVNQWLTTAVDGNLSGIPTGSQNLKQWKPCHG